MTAAAVKTSEPPRMGKRELAEKLGWSRPKLDRRLEQDPHFPVLQRGDRTGGWEFDLAAVVAYLSGRPAPAPVAPVAVAAALDLEREPAAEPADAGDVVVAFERPVSQAHRGEATARQMRDQADAELKIDRLKRQRGELVEAAQLKQAVSVLLVELRSSLVGMPDALVKEFDLPEKVGFAMKRRVEAMMRSAAGRVRQELGVEPAPAE